MDLTIELNFQQMEALNHDILSIVFKLQKNSDRVLRLSLVAESLKLTKKYDNLLAINDFQINQMLEPSSEYLFQYDKNRLVLSDLKLKLREAQLKSKKQEDLFDQIDKNEYLKNAYELEEEKEIDGDIDTMRSKLLSHRNNKDGIPKKTNVEKLNEEITSKYLKARRLLETSAFQSDTIIEDFNQSTNSLKNLNESFDVVNDLLDVAKSLVHSLNKLSSKQRTNLKYSLYFFIGCCAFVILRRTLGVFAKVYWLLTLPTKVILLPFRVVFSILRLILEISGSRKIEDAERIFELTETLIVDTITSLNEKIATTISDISSTTSAITSSTSAVVGYEEFSRKINSVINEDDLSPSSLAKAISSVTERIVDEL